MSSTAATARGTLAAALAALEVAAGDVVSALDAAGHVDAGHDELAEVIVGIRRVNDRCESSYLRCVRRVDQAGSFAVDGATSMTSWLRWRARHTRPAAAAAVTTARELDTRLPTVARLLADGRVSAEAARVVARSVHGTSDADTAALEPIAVAAALEVAPDGVAKAIPRYRYCLDPDEGVEPRSPDRNARG